ncbi:tetratricopeptide repeat protein [Pseudobacteriovorax antillogorgiicola]|uniref:Tfp pilus assembly protein PilF n=1 Tax=Pseudobacteriovorax antillogorgiicola TaxID=1513793 RepID=A0A1Y6B649_9BACT|nr:tetratricopeptide repeat protein [Pseudobacteriovorax antillogorgiicola]TCS59272.1 Tfp pilus assembly protein PilF [Pseudobacteriovorax antillogorgiicola]SME89869.1 Tfp pilus assembly protein PilF [Pseudobacteriovorax antillogorgiicola]
MPSIRAKLREIQEKVSIYLSVNRFGAAEKLLHESIEELGALSNLHNLLGLTFHRQSKFGLAIQQFQKALELNPKFIEAGLNLTILYCDLGLYQQGEQQYQNLNQTFASGSRQLPSLFLGRLANLHCQTAEYYEKAGLRVEAIKEYEKALSIFPSMPDKIYSLASLEYEVGHLEKAKARLREFSGKFAPNTNVYNLLGLIHYREGDYTNAHNYWTKSQEINTEDRISRSLIRCLREAPPQAPKA